MAIPNEVLSNWTNYQTAAVNSAKETYNKISDSFESNFLLSRHDIDTFLQGSYANTTLVRGSGDVDIVVRLNDSFVSDLTDLAPEEKEMYTNSVSSSSYSWYDFRSDVLDVLEDTFGSGSISEGDKAIEVDSSSLPLGADVVICLQFRKYMSINDYPGNYEKGIVFWTRSSDDRIVNFPEQHKENGSEKQDQSNNRYKETVRMFKNGRNKLDEEDMLSKDEVPSYFVECLLYNVPSDRYVSDLQERFDTLLDYLENASVDGFYCQNELLPLFGDQSTQWKTEQAEKFIENMRDLYVNW